MFIEFELDRDIDVAAQDVRDKVASIRADLPVTHPAQTRVRSGRTAMPPTTSKTPLR